MSIYERLLVVYVGPQPQQHLSFGIKLMVLGVHTPTNYMLISMTTCSNSWRATASDAAPQQA